MIDDVLPFIAYCRMTFTSTMLPEVDRFESEVIPKTLFDLFINEAPSRKQRGINTELIVYRYG